MASKKEVLIYVRLLDEDIDVFRPVNAYEMGGNVFRICESNRYNREDEKWEFEPGETVVCDKRKDDENVIWIALESAKSD